MPHPIRPEHAYDCLKILAHAESQLVEIYQGVAESTSPNITPQAVANATEEMGIHQLRWNALAFAINLIEEHHGPAVTI